MLVIEQGDYGQPWDAIGVALNWGTWLVFLVELVVMLRVVPDRRLWVRRNPLAVVVTVLTPPFFPALGPLRFLRLLRVLRLLPGVISARRVFSLEGLRNAAVLAAVTAVAGGAGYAAIEHTSAADGVYWALTTMTTVGYGDLSPTTTGGKVLAAVVMLVGIGFVAIMTGAIAERFLAPEVEREAAEIEAELDAADEALLAELSGVRAQLDRIEAAVRRTRRAS